MKAGDLIHYPRNVNRGFESNFLITKTTRHSVFLRYIPTGQKEACIREEPRSWVEKMLEDGLFILQKG